MLAEYENNKPPSKLHPLHKGPLRAINTSRNGHIYTLQDLVTNENKDDPDHTDPRLIANKDSQKFDVDQILEYTGDRYGSNDQ